ncbi:hypothetical protein GBA52_020434 [Prunus armeniaca]|nr:hypothetical protein GBA52_020434 [Prunus armeniaca]
MAKNSETFGVMSPCLWVSIKSLKNAMALSWPCGLCLSCVLLYTTGTIKYFGYDKYQYNVLEVNNTSYEKCIDKDFIKNITGGAGRDVFNLTQTKTYYFLSSGGYCFQGLKVAVNVLRPMPPAPAPTSTSTTSTFSSSLLLLMLLLLIII